MDNSLVGRDGAAEVLVVGMVVADSQAPLGVDNQTVCRVVDQAAVDIALVDILVVLQAGTLAGLLGDKVLVGPLGRKYSLVDDLVVVLEVRVDIDCYTLGLLK